MLSKGTELTLEEATKVLEFMRKVANIVVASYLEKIPTDSSSKEPQPL